jgi:CRISPR-associated protein Csd1
MIINALCEYYDILAKDASIGISPYGYQKTTFAYDVILTEDGELAGIVSLVPDKKDRPKSAIMPTSMKSSSIAASPVCDNLTYIFGVEGKKGEEKIDARKFEAAKELHLRLYEDAMSKEAVAVRRFFEKWNPYDAWRNEHILFAANDKGNAFAGNGAFKLRGGTTYFHECEEIKSIWLKENEEKAAAEGQYVAQCSITGDTAPIARIHTQLSGVKGAQVTGTSLVCFKKDADASYNLSQSFNSRVSEMAMFKYTTALQYLLDSKDNKLYIGDDTTVFWACSPNNRALYEGMAMGFFAPMDDDEDADSEPKLDRGAEEKVKTILNNGIKGLPSDAQFDPEVMFYVLGLAPNAGRVSVRYFYQSSFGEFYQKIKRYQDDTSICGFSTNIKINRLIFTTVSSKSKDKKPNPLLGGAVMRAVLSGEKYPTLLFSQVILRAKAEAAVNQVKAAAIKAYLIRNREEENLSMYLNEGSKSTAYNLGRAFAILEKIQKSAYGDNLNRTIKDKYFASACSTPALVFPTLLKLAQNHLSKISGNYYNTQLGKCLALIEGETFPKTHSMEEQGSFMLGYYQQTQKPFEPPRDKATDKEEDK